MSRGRADVGGQRYGCRVGRPTKYLVKFVGRDGDEIGKKLVSARLVTEEDDSRFLMWRLGAVSGHAEWNGYTWIAEVWNDEESLRQFPHTAQWLLDYFGRIVI